MTNKKLKELYSILRECALARITFDTLAVMLGAFAAIIYQLYFYIK